MNDEDADDFYEEDEPIEVVKSRLTGRHDFVTAVPQAGVTRTFYPTSNTAWNLDQLNLSSEIACH